MLIERLMIFIDGQNLLYSTKKEYKIDYEKLIEHFKSNFGEVRRTYYFTGYDPRNTAQQKFFKYLRRIGVEVLEKKLSYRNINCKFCGKTTERPMEKGVDVSLVTTLIDMGTKNAYDTAIVISGDKDLLPALQLVKNLGKRVILSCFREFISQDAQLSADKFYPLDTIIKDIIDKPCL